MSYELTRFVEGIGDEFLCSICKLVMETPIEAICGHPFCKSCIKDRKFTATCLICQADRQPVFPDFKIQESSFRRLLCELIKCDFQSSGCPTITELESLGQHVINCRYNLYGKVVCDKGCNMTITQREYQRDNCLSHLAKEISKLNLELKDQKGQIRNLLEIVGGHPVDQQKIAELSDKINVTMHIPLNWEHRFNVLDELSVFRVDDTTSDCPRGFVQSNRLNPTTSSFRISAHSYNFGHMYPFTYIGLTSNTRPNLSLSARETSVYSSSGSIICDFYNSSAYPEWSYNDVIECGIKFPVNFVNDGKHSATVYFCKNEEIVFEKSMNIPCTGFFPTICFSGKYTRVKYHP